MCYLSNIISFANIMKGLFANIINSLEECQNFDYECFVVLILIKQFEKVDQRMA